ncbi:MAG TPA: ABC transporter permease [Selenomonadales bacterium]|nr:ABC transporter permease [Selenomonadales bacterium]
MILWLIAWRNLWAKPLQNLLTVAVVATALAMTVLVMLVAASVHYGLVRATEPFDLLVGAKGSPNQLVLNTVFLQDAPIGNIDYAIAAELAASPLVDTAIAMGFGDNYRGYRLVGTEPALFEHRGKAGQPPWLQIDQGRPFQAPFEAVLGAKTAKETGLKLGGQFVSSHGVVAGGETHAGHAYTVVGILRPVGGPYDQAILTSLQSIWQAHSHEPEPKAQAAVSPADGADDDDDDHDHGATAVLVKPKGYAEALRLYQQFQKDRRAQLVFPSQVVANLFALLGQGEKALSLIGYSVLAMALLLVSFSMYWSSLSRTRDRAILRAVGASWTDIFWIILAEGVLVVWSGVLAGVLAGHGLFSLLTALLQQKTGIAFAGPFPLAEAYAVAGALLVGLLAAVIPAWSVARRSIAENLEA